MRSSPSAWIGRAVDALAGLPPPFLRFAFRGTFLRFHSGHDGLLPRVQQRECRHRNSIQSLMPTTRFDVSVFCSWTKTRMRIGCLSSGIDRSTREILRQRDRTGRTLKIVRTRRRQRTVAFGLHLRTDADHLVRRRRFEDEVEEVRGRPEAADVVIDDRIDRRRRRQLAARQRRDAADRHGRRRNHRQAR